MVILLEAVSLVNTEIYDGCCRLTTSFLVGFVIGAKPSVCAITVLAKAKRHALKNEYCILKMMCFVCCYVSKKWVLTRVMGRYSTNTIRRER